MMPNFSDRRGSRPWASSLLVLAMSLAVAPSADAWGPTGHMIVAQIAYDELRPEVRAEADRLIALLADDEPRADHFVPAAYWMDQLRRNGWRAFDHWHYTNRPINGDGLGDVPPEDRHNVAWAIHQAVATLKNDRAGDQQKAWMLRVLVHLVGDAHQPLHCVARFTHAQPKGDRGGNLFLLDGKAPNLHAYWDGLAGRFPNVDPNGAWQSRIAAYAEEVRRAADGVDGRRDLQPDTWVRESFALAHTAVYEGVKEGSEPSAAYRRRAQDASVRRLAQAGHRLAALLNESLRPAR